MNKSFIIALSLFIKINASAMSSHECYKKETNTRDVDQCFELIELEENYKFQQTQMYKNNPEEYDELSQREGYSKCLHTNDDQSNCSIDFYKRLEDNLPLYGTDKDIVNAYTYDL